MDEHMMVSEIAALKNEIETLTGMVKAERAKVIAEIRDYVRAWASPFPGCGMQVSQLAVYKKLDSMEDKTNV